MKLEYPTIYFITTAKMDIRIAYGLDCLPLCTQLFLRKEPAMATSAYDGHSGMVWESRSFRVSKSPTVRLGLFTNHVDLVCRSRFLLSN